MEENKEAQEQNLTVVTDRRAASMARIDDQALTPAPNPAALVQLALTQKVDTEQLKALMELQERWEAREAQKLFTRAMADFKAACPAVLAKDGQVDFTSSKGRTAYKHATLGGICDTITPHLSRFGLSVGWAVTQLDKGLVTVKTTITHVAGHSESVTLCAPRDESGNKNAIQSIGSTATYLQRYGVLMALGLATSEQDDDARAGGGTPKTQPGEPRRPEAQRDTKLDERIRKTAALFKRWGSSMDDLVRRFEGVVAESWTEEQWATVKRWNTELKEAATSERAALLVKYKLAPEREPGQEG